MVLSYSELGKSKWTNIYRSKICVVMLLEELMGEMLSLFGMIDNIIKKFHGQVCFVMNLMHTTHRLLLPF